MAMFDKQENETTYKYIKRMTDAVNDSVWTEGYKEWMEQVFGCELSEDESRKEFYGIKRMMAHLGEMSSKEEKENEDLMSALIERELQIDKKRIKMSDEISYLQRIKRSMARNETIKDYAVEAAKAAAEKEPLNICSVKYVGEKTEGSNVGVLCLSDWHYGMVVDNAINVYNPEVAKERLNKLMNAVYKDINLFGLEEIVVANLGDLINGVIHTTVRLENRIDVITQTMEVSELMCNIILGLSKYVKVSYFSVIDNHGRVIQDKNDNIDKENFNRIVDFYIKKRCEGVENIQIISEGIDDGIMSFRANGWNFCGVHGHNDSPDKVLENLSGMLHIDYDMVIMGHTHNVNIRESHGDLAMVNGSLCGTNDYAKNHRKSSRPSQNMIIVSASQPCEYLHIIDL